MEQSGEEAMRSVMRAVEQHPKLTGKVRMCQGEQCQSEVERAISDGSILIMLEPRGPEPLFRRLYLVRSPALILCGRHSTVSETVKCQRFHDLIEGSEIAYTNGLSGKAMEQIFTHVNNFLTRVLEEVGHGDTGQVL
ncbi:hypothetical protein GCM10007108_15310 [Thermogymnomonas acidicola]|uniref:Uncharacterized protein n=1 Tax=Thermogymnomonas acidicola TaxID=399579 RepID=A0AA37BSB7_9ARCH|nr:hypothetical protein [Thermogymnomonas acidicola]GGM78063.1 hypothetical protein GCM10007108_15310 [Thermogymnomonas acidicola]